MPTVPTFAVRKTDVSRTANVGTVGMHGSKQTPPPQSEWSQRLCASLLPSLLDLLLIADRPTNRAITDLTRELLLHTPMYVVGSGDIVP